MEELLEKDILTKSLVFNGAKENPFLAPRGVCLVNNHLFVSDTGQNRVFVWKSLPETEYQAPDLILGQNDEMDTARNAGDKVTASSLQYPSGIWSDGIKLIVADAWNHRILIWNTMPQTNGQPADVVLGQPDFESNETNAKGIGAKPTAQTMNWPYGVYSDGNQLWVADTGNRRVLYYKTIPNVNYMPADEVIGQPSFEDRDYNPENAIWPYSVKVSPSGQLAITDTQYFRVLVWHNWRDALLQQADCIIGQKDFAASGQNQFQLKPSSNTLNWCYDSHFQGNALWVADTGNSRLLYFDRVPKSHSTPAVDVIGHDDFETGSENANTVNGTENSLYWPFSISMSKGLLAIADTGNHRIILKHYRTE